MRTVFGEATAKDDHAIGLKGQGIDESVSARAEVNGGINRAIGEQASDLAASDAAGASELTGEEDAIIGLNGNGGDEIISPEADVEGRIDRTVGVEASETVKSAAIEIGE